MSLHLFLMEVGEVLGAEAAFRIEKTAEGGARAIFTIDGKTVTVTVRK